MIIIITGTTHTGKTLLAQRLLEKYKYPYLSIDLMKMGLIRSGTTELTALDDEKMTEYLWPIVREIIKTAIENRQNLIIEGVYIPFDWRRSFTENESKEIRFVCLSMTEHYIDEHFDDILLHESDIETRKFTGDVTAEEIKEDNKKYAEGFRSAGEYVLFVDEENVGKVYNRCEKVILYSHPVFPSFDIRKTAEYYVSVLGFSRKDYLNCDEPHICLYRDDVEIILTKADKLTVPNHEMYGYGYDAYFITERQAELQEEFLKSGAEIVRSLGVTDYKNSEFVIKDIDGRLLAFGVKQK